MNYAAKARSCEKMLPLILGVCVSVLPDAHYVLEDFAFSHG
jgi:hypothetical protein